MVPQRAGASMERHARSDVSYHMSFRRSSPVRCRVYGASIMPSSSDRLLKQRRTRHDARRYSCRDASLNAFVAVHAVA